MVFLEQKSMMQLPYNWLTIWSMRHIIDSCRGDARQLMFTF